VHLAIDNVTGGEVAVKLIERGGATSSGVLRSELINHSALGYHPHVIALKVRLQPQRQLRSSVQLLLVSGCLPHCLTLQGLHFPRCGCQLHVTA